MWGVVLQGRSTEGWCMWGVELQRSVQRLQRFVWDLTVLDSGFHAGDSGWIPGTEFQSLSVNVYSGFQSLVGLRIPWAILWIRKPQANFADFEFHKQKFPEFQNPDCHTYGETVGLVFWEWASCLSMFLLISRPRVSSVISQGSGGWVS